MVVQELYIARNYIDPNYCPVIHLLTWLTLSGIQHGPIFPGLSRDHKQLHFGSHNSSSAVSTWLRRMFVYTGGPVAGCTTHSFRKASVSWMSRCGKGEAEIQNIGRWTLNSTSFRRYMAHGLAIAKKWATVARSTKDPVYKFWVCKTAAIDPIGA